MRISTLFPSLSREIFLGDIFSSFKLIEAMLQRKYHKTNIRGIVATRVRRMYDGTYVRSISRVNVIVVRHRAFTFEVTLFLGREIVSKEGYSTYNLPYSTIHTVLIFISFLGIIVYSQCSTFNKTVKKKSYSKF